MRRTIIPAVIVTVAVMSAAFADAGIREWWFGEPWDFIQDAGGIRVGGATRASDGAVSIAVDCDVSGSRFITRQPEHLDSAVGVRKLLAAVEGHRIAISVRTGLGSSSTCAPLRFERLDPGEYSIVYLGADRAPHEVGTVVVR